MKKTYALFLITFLFVHFLSSQSLTNAWNSEAVFLTPESVLVDNGRKQIYVSNINGKPTDKDGNGFISVLEMDGKIKNLKWIEGLNAPKGMAIYGDNLFVTDIDRIAIIDIQQGKILSLIEVPGAMFLNDMIADKMGRVFITDMQKNQILVYENGAITLWSDDNILVSPNGLAMENGKLLTGCSDYLLQIDPETKQIKKHVTETGGIDGLIPLGKEKYIISDWSGKIQLIGVDIAPIVLQNTTDEKIQAADLGYIPNENIILIPTFFNNKVRAMKFNP